LFPTKWGKQKIFKFRIALDSSQLMKTLPIYSIYIDLLWTVWEKVEKKLLISKVIIFDFFTETHLHRIWEK